MEYHSNENEMHSLGAIPTDLGKDKKTDNNWIV